VDSDQRKGTSRGARSQFDTSGSSNSVFFNCLKDLGLKCCIIQIAFVLTYNRSSVMNFQ
jgi:hypothetical protein